MTVDIGWTGLGASTVLIALAVVLSMRQRLNLERTIVYAAARAGVQLLAVGSALTLVFDSEAPLALAWAWVVAMMLFAALTIRARSPGVPAVFWIGLVSITVVVVLSLGVIFGLGIFPLEARTLVPLAGMMIGNAMSEGVLSARRVMEEVGDNRLDIEARLALGQPAADAVRPFVRRAVKTAILPQIERTKAVGLVILPGAMTGLILAGVEPIDAVQVQVVIMYLILGSVVLSTSVIALGLSRRLFTADQRLRRLTFRPAP
jgi:putative ABC transport system permease protein